MINVFNMKTVYKPEAYNTLRVLRTERWAFASIFWGFSALQRCVLNIPLYICPADESKNTEDVWNPNARFEQPNESGLFLNIQFSSFGSTKLDRFGFLESYIFFI